MIEEINFWSIKLATWQKGVDHFITMIFAVTFITEAVSVTILIVCPSILNSSNLCKSNFPSTFAVALSSLIGTSAMVNTSYLELVVQYIQTSR